MPLVRDYHKSYYRPDNLCLIITGKVDKNELLKVLEPVEESIIKRGPLPEMQRPWISTGDFPNLEKNIEETVLFADEDESMGTVLIAWNGPMCSVSGLIETVSASILTSFQLGLPGSKRIGGIKHLSHRFACISIAKRVCRD